MRSAAARQAECPPPPNDVPPVQDLVGLALSGGGIRSASFNLGVLQGLAERRALWLFDYLSTVSGGGFIGAWWSAWLSREPRMPGDIFPPSEELEPRRRQETAVLLDARGNASPVPSLPDGSLIARRRDPIHFVRLFSNYLTPKTGAFSPDTWRMIAFYLRNLVFTWAALLPLALAAVVAAQAFYLAGGNAAPFLCHPLEQCPDTLPVTLARIGVPLQLILSAAATFALLWLAHSSARVVLGLAGLLVVAIVGTSVLQRVFADGGGFTLHWGVWVVAAICVALHLVSSYRKHERTTARGAGIAMIVRASAADHRAWLTHQLAFVLKWGTFLMLLLVFAGFGHLVLHAMVNGTANLLQDQVARAGGMGGLLVTLVSAAYTIVKATPSSTGTVGKAPGKLGRLLITLAPPLVLLLLALCFAVLSHALLRASIRFDATSALDHTIVVELAKAAVILAGLEVLFGIFESLQDPTTPLPEGAFSWRRFVPDPIQRLFGRRQLPSGGSRAWYFLFSPRGWVRVSVLGALLVGWLVADRAALSAFLADPLRQLQWSTVAAFAILLAALVVTFARRSWRVALGSARPATLLSIATISAALCILTNGTVATGARYEPVLVALLWIALMIGAVIAVGWLADPNLLSLHGFYKERLARAYLGASNAARKNEEITDAAPGDDVRMTALWNHDAGAPYHLVNTTLSLVGGSDLAMSQRSAENFVMSRYHCGSARTGYRCTADYMSGKLSLGTAAAVSGAAVSPTMGSQTPSAALALLLSLFNVRLGFWAPTPSGRRWNEPHARLWPFYLLRETLSNTGTLGTYCYLTDGGHFDNTALYALVERGCRYIVVCDCGADPRLGFEDIGVAIRRCRIDFGVEIDLHIDAFRAREDASDTARTHVVWGTIKYQREHLEMLGLDTAKNAGVIVWVKPSVTALNAADVRQYRLAHADFPQQTTADQWYDESQFESYRRLGYESARDAFDPAHHSPPRPLREGDFSRVADWFTAPRASRHAGNRYSIFRPLKLKRTPSPPGAGSPQAP